jgi:hypothetical protein
MTKLQSCKMCGESHPDCEPPAPKKLSDGEVADKFHHEEVPGQLAWC